EVCERRVQEPQRVREMDLPERVERRPGAAPCRRRGPFADAVEAQHRSTLERAEIECRRRMGLMVLGEQQWRELLLGHTGEPRKLAAQSRLEVDLLLQPYRHRGEKRPQPLWGVVQVRLEQALELYERLVVENDVVEIRDSYAA